MGELPMTGPQIMASVTIDADYLAEIADDPSEPRTILGWGLTIAGESYLDNGATEGIVHLGQDGGKESRHVGTWRVY